MSDQDYEFKIIFEELERLAEKTDILLEEEELENYNAIRALREIVLEMQTPAQTYQTST